MWQRGRKDGGAKGFLFLVFNYFYFLLGEVYKGVGRAWRPGKLGCMVWNFQRLNFKNYTKRNLRKESIQKRKEGRKERLLQSKKDDSWRGVESRTEAVPGERNRGVGHLFDWQLQNELGLERDRSDIHGTSEAEKQSDHSGDILKIFLIQFFLFS